MNNKHNETTDLEKELETYFQAAEPSTEFIKKLEVKLQNEHHKNRAFDQTPQRSTNFRRVFAPAMAILFLMITIVIIVGPKQVLAQAQALLGYVPGFGFVDIADTRLLLAPVSQTQQGVTVTVKQVLSNQDGTYVVLRVDGLPSKEEILADIRSSMQETGQDWSTGEPEIWRTEASLTLADGKVFEDSGFGGAPWEGYYIFPPLPKGELQLTFATDRIPGILAERAPGNWSFDLQLGYVSETQEAPALEDYVPGSGMGGSLLSVSVPMNISSTSDAMFGFSLELVEVIYADTETALRIRFNGIPDCGLAHPCYFNGQLIDDLGTSYPIIYGPSSGFQSDGSYLVTFEPLTSEASALTFSATEIGLNMAIESQSILVNMGENPQAGEAFLIDQTISVLGVPVTFKEVSITQEVNPMDKSLMNMLEFVITSTPLQHGDEISGVEFAQNWLESFTTSSGASEGIQVLQGSHGNQINLSLGIPADRALPTGEVEFVFDRAQITLAGPLTISWDLK